MADGPGGRAPARRRRSLLTVRQVRVWPSLVVGVAACAADTILPDCPIDAPMGHSSERRYCS